MDRVEWQKKHQEECYLPAAKAYLEEILQDVSLRAREIHKELTGQVDAFLQSLCVLQEIGKLGVVRTVSISFPYTSLVCGNPYFLFEVYPGEPFLDEAVVIREFPVSWMFSGWEDFLAQVKRETGECGMNAVIRMPYIKSQSLGTARMVVSLMATLIKYHLYGLEETESYRKLKKAEDFVLSFGEYSDWQKPLLAERKEIDIFQCERDTDLRFCRFRGAWYEEKEFGTLILDDCQFLECTFTGSRFLKTSFKDARFLGCVFKNCDFLDLDLHGARFDGCVFENVNFSGVKTNNFSPETKEITAFWGMAEFIGCSISKAVIKSCDLSASYFRDCQVRAVEVEESSMPDSFHDCQTKMEGEKD